MNREAQFWLVAWCFVQIVVVAIVWGERRKPVRALQEAAPVMSCSRSAR